MKILITLAVAFSLPLFANAAPKFTVVRFENKQEQYSFLGCKIRNDGWTKRTIANYVAPVPGEEFAWRVYLPIEESECNSSIINYKINGLKLAR